MNPECKKILGTARDVGYPIPEGSTVLDLGCGAGELVWSFQEAGFEAWGCDISFKPGPHVEALEQHGRIRRIQWDPYRLPFEDQSFDLVVSLQVFEHVQNYPETLREIARVLKPDGVALHQFPSRYRPIETHVFVPFASWIQADWWLGLWARLGVRKPSQREMSAPEVARENAQYLRERTNYLTRGQLSAYVSEVFPVFRFCEVELARYSKLGRYHGVLSVVPFFGRFISEFHSRAILTARSGGHR